MQSLLAWARCANRLVEDQPDWSRCLPEKWVIRKGRCYHMEDAVNPGLMDWSRVAQDAPKSSTAPAAVAVHRLFQASRLWDCVDHSPIHSTSLFSDTHSATSRDLVVPLNPGSVTSAKWYCYGLTPFNTGITVTTVSRSFLMPYSTPAAWTCL